MRLPLEGKKLMKPLATDLSATTSSGSAGPSYAAAARCTAASAGLDGGDITPSEDNAKVILMVLGKSAPQPPAPSGDSYPPGCLIGK